MFEFLKRERKLIQCDFCPSKFLKGTGHLCWCSDCKVVHTMCNPCYKEAKIVNQIKDKEINITDIDEKNRERYT